jgi:hypothetical protein
MGVFGWFGSRRKDSLIRTRGPVSSREEQVQQAAADDVAIVEQDDKYFSSHEPANEEAE